MVLQYSAKWGLSLFQVTPVTSGKLFSANMVSNARGIIIVLLGNKIFTKKISKNSTILNLIENISGN